MFKFDYKDRYWNYLLFCAIYLTLGLTGWSVGFVLAIIMAVIQLINTYIDHRQPGAFPVQVRLAYTLLLLAALPESMNWLYWLPTIGTWIYVLFGYCLLARTLSLLPFISKQPVSLERMRDTFLARPMKNILNPA